MAGLAGSDGLLAFSAGVSTSEAADSSLWLLEEDEGEDVLDSSLDNSEDTALETDEATEALEEALDRIEDFVDMASESLELVLASESSSESDESTEEEAEDTMSLDFLSLRSLSFDLDSDFDEGFDDRSSSLLTLLDFLSKSESSEPL